MRRQTAILFSLLILGNLFCLRTVDAEPIIAEALVARVGRDAVLLTDLVRFKEIEQIMICAKLRDKSQSGTPDVEHFQALLNRYIEEELMFQESRTKKSSTSSRLREAVQAIQAKPSCLHTWQELGNRFSILWGTPSRPKEGEAQLVRELEKRLIVQNFEKEQIQGDRSAWLRGARVKTPIKLFLD